MDEDKKPNVDLILREKLAIQRTILANQTTFLAFLRTSMYFLVAGLSVKNFMDFKNGFIVVNGFYVISFIIFLVGMINYFWQRKKILKSKIHIGQYKIEYENNR